jgi:hypothetical protein
MLKGVRDVEVDGREGSVVRIDIFPASADCRDSAVWC